MTKEDADKKLAEWANMKLRYNFIGIGKILLEQEGADYHVPYLHFLLDKREDGRVEAINIEFALVSVGDNAEEAVKMMGAMLIDHVRLTMTIGYEQLIDEAVASATNELWEEYTRIEFTLAQKKRDLSHKLVQQIIDAVTRDLLEKFAVSADIDVGFIKKAA